MSLHLRLLGLSALGLLSTAVTARSQDYVGQPVALPGQPVYVAAPNIVTQTTVVRTPIGPTAFVQAPPVVAYPPQRFVTTTYVPNRFVRRGYVPAATYIPTTTYVPTTTQRVLADPGLVPVGYEVVRPGRTKVVYPRRVVRYVY